MSTTQTEDAALFKRVLYWKEFRNSAQHLFKTDDSLRWFIRKHERALLQSGVLLKFGRGNFIDPEPFQAKAIHLLRIPQFLGERA